MPDAPDRKLTPAEADEILARAASLDAEGDGTSLSAEEIRQSALAAGIAPHAVERALQEARAPLPGARAGATGSYMGLPAVQRANAVAAGAPRRSPREIAMRLRAALGPDATISEELGTVRARLGHTVLTVIPGANTQIAVTSDLSSDIAVTGIAAVAGGVISALVAALVAGLGSNTTVVVAMIPAGIIAGGGLWQALWRRTLRAKSRELDALAATAAAALSAPDT